MGACLRWPSRSIFARERPSFNLPAGGLLGLPTTLCAESTRSKYNAMSNAVLDVSVVICAYTEERWDNLVAAVASLESQSTPPREIILVVDNNTDLFERARSHLLSTVVIENREQRGLSGARNSGVAIAEGMLIAFLDDDAIAEPDWLELLSRCCQNPCVLGAGGI